MRASALLLFALFAPPAAAATCVVTSTMDQVPALPGTLRACIELANGQPGKDRISFDATAFSPGVILVSDSLPALTDPEGTLIEAASGSVTISGATAPDATGFTLASDNNELRGLTISDFQGGGFGTGTGVQVQDGARANVIDGVTFDSNAGGAIDFVGSNHGTVVSGSQFRGNGFTTIRIFGTAAPCSADVRIAGNTFVDNNLSDDGDDIYVVSAECVVISGNSFSNNDQHAVRLTSLSTKGVRILENTFTGTGVGFFGESTGTQFLGNVLRDSTLRLGDPGRTSATIARNVFVGASDGDGLFLFDGAGETVIAHNVFAQIPLAAIRMTGVAGVRIHNNVFAEAGGAAIVAQAPLDASSAISHNAFFSATPCQGCDASASALMGDPGFVAPGVDFHLAGCSAPGVDRGVDLGAAQPDLTTADDGRTFNGAAPDLGAFETDCGANIDAAMPPRELVVACGCTATDGAGSAWWLASLAFGWSAARAGRMRLRSGRGAGRPLSRPPPRRPRSAPRGSARGWWRSGRPSP